MPDNISKVSVANMVLTLLGEAAITSFDDETDEARAVKRVYDITLDAALRDHNWNFAQLRRGLAKSAAKPEYDFDNQYVLPTDPYCLRVLETDLDEDEPWRIETYFVGAEKSRVLLTDACSVEILYVARMDDPAIWDGLFTEAFVFDLAYRLSYTVTRNSTLTAVLQKEKDLAWRRARSRDGQESRALKKFLSNSWTSIR